MYTIEPTTMQITLREKNILLSQIAGVLSDLNCLVSKLMSVKCQDEDDQVKSYPEEDVSSVSSQESGSLLWDTTEDFPVYLPPPPLSLNLFFPDSNSDDESESLQMCQSVNKSKPEKCSFVQKIESFISSNFPSNVYDKLKMKENRLNNDAFFAEFQSLWRHSIVGDLFIQNPEANENCTTTTSAPEIRYKTVDFSRVNVRSIANVPKPTTFPIHGCSEDPKFYSEIVKLDSVDYYGRHYTRPCRHQTSTPFGSQFGYQTNDGIVPVPSSPVHGYVWSDELRDWILHAIHPDECSPARAPWTGPRSPTRRPPPTRRGWQTSRPRREGKE